MVENILMARTLMYSAVYFHKTVRIAELMLSKAIELIEGTEPFEFFKMTDAELINDLKKKGSFQQEIATRLKYRNLYKQAYTASKLNLNEAEIGAVKRLEDVKRRREKEEELEKSLRIPRGHVIIDIPYKELHEAEPRISQTDIIILDEKGTKKLDDYTPIANAIKLRSIPDWIIMIVTDEKYRDIVSKKAERILFK